MLNNGAKASPKIARFAQNLNFFPIAGSRLNGSKTAKKRQFGRLGKHVAMVIHNTNRRGLPEYRETSGSERRGQFSSTTCDMRTCCKPKCDRVRRSAE